MGLFEVLEIGDYALVDHVILEKGQLSFLEVEIAFDEFVDALKVLVGMKDLSRQRMILVDRQKIVIQATLQEISKLMVFRSRGDGLN